ncbi:MAG: zf-HC2 domain-containing protein [Calditrichaeota bacterium]|nr:zf-HC2 domain-containing protein [Calditrichota bacterium]
MSCKEKEIAELLPWFINDTLLSHEKKKIEQHLKQCRECQTTFQEMKKLSLRLTQENKELLSDHILSAKLVQYAEAKNELPADEKNFIEAHLKTCFQCRNELEILGKVDASLREKRWLQILLKIKENTNTFLPKTLAKPALAYIIILLLLYPAYLGIFQRKTMTEPGVVQQNYQLLQFNSRAEEESLNEIKLDAQTDIFTLSFTLPVLISENIRYNAEIFDSADEIIWQKQGIKSLDEYGTFLIFCHSRFFRGGLYSLQISEFNKAKKQVEERFLFSFKIVKEK